MSTLSELISQQFGSEQEEPATGVTLQRAAGVEKVASTRFDHDGIEKLAAACEFLGTHGVARAIGLDKEAMDMGGKAHGGSPTTNEHSQPKDRKHIYVGHNKQSPPLGSTGSPTNNESDDPGDNKGANTAAHERMSHPGLRSAASATAVTKADKARLVSPALRKVLSAMPFADPVPKHDLANARGAGERNIHAGKSKTAGDAAMLKQAIIYKLSQQNGEA